MRKFRYIPRMHDALRAACPEGYRVMHEREGNRLYTLVLAEDCDYFAPWLIEDIVSHFGFDTLYA